MVTNYNATDMVDFGQFCADLVKNGMLFPNEKISKSHFENWKVGVDNIKTNDTALKEAELLIMKLSPDDPSRQNWLIKNGVGLESEELRKRKRIREVHDVLSKDETVANFISDSFGQGKSMRVFSAKTDDGRVFTFEVPLYEVDEKDIPHQLPAVDLIEYLKL